MSAIAMPAVRPPVVAAPDRLQPAHRDRARDRRVADRLLHRQPHPRQEPRLLLDRGRAERHRDPARLPVRGRRLPDRARVRQLPAPADARPPADARRARVRGRGDRPLLPPVHRPQGRRDAVPRRDRRVLLRRRAQRDADPDRAAAAEHARVRRQPVPDAGRHARHDDDGDDDLGDPGAVRELGRAADDRLAPDGVPADRVVHVLAADGGRRDPDHDDLLRRLPDRLDRLSAARRPEHRRLRRVHRLLRAGRGVDVPARASTCWRRSSRCARPG